MNVAQESRRSGRPPQVALLVETSTTFGRQVLRGIAIFVRENGPWTVHVEQRSIYDPPPAWLKTWRGDGIISRAAWPEVAEISRKHGIPAVDLNEQVMDFGLPLIANDQHAIGRLPCAVGRASRRFDFAATPTSRRPSTSTAGMPTA